MEIRQANFRGHDRALRHSRFGNRPSTRRPLGGWGAGFGDLPVRGVSQTPRST